MKAKTAYMGLFLAFAMILSYIETLIPFQSTVPGIKLGLANLAVVLCLYRLGYREALLLTVTKALVCGFLFGNLFMIGYSMAGALCSYGAMALMKKSGRFHIPVVSMTGGVMHNMGQLFLAFFVIETYGVIYYAPFLIIAGLLTGAFIGAVSSLVMPYLPGLP